MLTGFFESDLDLFCVPNSDSVQYHSNFTEDMPKYALKRAKNKLYDVIKQFTNVDDLEYPNPRDPGFDRNALDHWLQYDSDLQDSADNFFLEIRNRLDQSLELTVRKLSFLEHGTTARAVGTVPKPNNPLAQAQPRQVPAKTIPGMVEETTDLDVGDRHNSTAAWVQSQNQQKETKLNTIDENQV